MQLSLLLLADYATADASGKLNILGVFDKLNARQFPAKHPLMHLVMKFQPEMREYGETRKLRVILVDEDGREVFQVAVDLAVPVITRGEIPDVNGIIGFRDLPFSKPGLYEFRVLIDKDQVGVAALTVIQMEQPQPEY
ncbi:MAG: hypothetical protein H7175_28350 [Burkholderiales bacterium]|nr:hypothetical protein [Anaerolineae bacterium]